MTAARRRAGTLATLAVVAAVAAACGPVRADEPPVAAPRLLVPEPVFDFGTAEQGSKVEHVFRVQNPGTALLRIDHVKTSCDCLAGMASAPDVPPGGEGRVNVILDTTRIAGRTTKVITVYGNDPAVPAASLTLTGQVMADLVAEPTALYLGKIRRGERAQREVRIVAGRPNATYEVTYVEKTNPLLHATVEKLPDGTGQRVVVELDPDAPLGRFNDQLTLHTTSLREPTMTVPVFASIEGDVVVLPPQVTFGVARAGATAERELWVRNRGTKPLALKGVEVPDRVVSYDVSTVTEGQEWKITLRLRDRLPPGKIEDRVVIFTDHPDESRVVVPLYAIVRDARGRS